jgi:proteic killer suppression protein
MIVSFRNKATSDIFHGKNTQMARKICPEILWKNARRKLDLLDSIVKLDELNYRPPIV